MGARKAVSRKLSEFEGDLKEDENGDDSFGSGALRVLHFIHENREHVHSYAQLGRVVVGIPQDSAHASTEEKRGRLFDAQHEYLEGLTQQLQEQDRGGEVLCLPHRSMPCVPRREPRRVERAIDERDGGGAESVVGAVCAVSEVNPFLRIALEVAGKTALERALNWTIDFFKEERKSEKRETRGKSGC